MTFCSTVRCGKRLWPWKTIALCARSAASSRFPGFCAKSTLTSPMPTTPASGRSRALSERRTVVLPEPDGPISTVTVPAATSKSTPRSTASSPNDFCSPLTVTSGGESLGVVMS